VRQIQIANISYGLTNFRLQNLTQLPGKCSVAAAKTSHVALVVRLVFKFHNQKQLFRNFGIENNRVSVPISPVIFLTGVHRVLTQTGGHDLIP
jgi:hypothetical protein